MHSYKVEELEFTAIFYPGLYVVFKMWKKIKKTFTTRCPKAHSQHAVGPTRRPHAVTFQASG